MSPRYDRQSLEKQPDVAVNIGGQSLVDYRRSVAHEELGDVSAILLPLSVWTPFW